MLYLFYNSQADWAHPGFDDMRAANEGRHYSSRTSSFSAKS